MAGINDIMVLLTPPEGNVPSGKPEMSPYPENAAPGVHYLSNILNNEVTMLHNILSATTGKEILNSPISFDASSLMKALSGVFAQTAWHGSPSVGIQKLSKEYIGSGQGHNTFGWGHYFTDLKEIAEHYRKQLSDTFTFYKGNKVDDELLKTLTPSEQLGLSKIRNAGGVKEAISNARRANNPLYEKQAIDEVSKETKVSKGGSIYKVDIPDDNKLLHWDVPLNEQPKQVAEALKSDPHAAPLYKEAEKLPEGFGPTGSDLYYTLSRKLGTYEDMNGKILPSQQSASEYLNSLGILGHKYPTGTLSGRTAEGTYNYVIYSDEPLKILDSATSLAEFENRMSRISKVGE